MPDVVCGRVGSPLARTRPQLTPPVARVRPIVTARPVGPPRRRRPDHRRRLAGLAPGGGHGAWRVPVRAGAAPRPLPQPWLSAATPPRPRVRRRPAAAPPPPRRHSAAARRRRPLPHAWHRGRCGRTARNRRTRSSASRRRCRPPARSHRVTATLSPPPGVPLLARLRRHRPNRARHRMRSSRSSSSAWRCSRSPRRCARSSTGKIRSSRCSRRSPWNDEQAREAGP